MTKIRFIDLGRQIDPAGPRRFGFWDTRPYSASDPSPRGFLGGRDGSECWASWDEFAAAYPESRMDGDDLTHADLRATCPAWATGDAEEAWPMAEEGMWTGVDRPPPAPGDYIGLHEEAETGLKVARPAYFDANSWHTLRHVYDHLDLKLTHWMPVPELPGDAEEA